MYPLCAAKKLDNFVTFYQKRTVLIEASDIGNRAIVDLLLLNGAIVNDTDEVRLFDTCSYTLS